MSLFTVPYFVICIECPFLSICLFDKCMPCLVIYLIFIFLTGELCLNFVVLKYFLYYRAMTIKTLISNISDISDIS